MILDFGKRETVLVHVNGSNDGFWFVPHAFKTIWSHELLFACGAPIALFGYAFSFSFAVFDDGIAFTENALHKTTGNIQSPAIYKSFVNYTMPPKARLFKHLRRKLYKGFL
ncbi:hypothetical protein HZC09_06010 [Candidatus Micrarchaeota archaeon]|nr:hypothetical protein [Candidatus Micrarchaeota archaeon]